VTKTVALHANLASGAWNELTIVEQLAHVGSEVERAIRAHAQDRADRFERAFDRALELFDLTAADDRWRGARRREVLRAREEFCALFFSNAAVADSEPRIRKYFFQFAIAARTARTSQGRTP
jgi:hypothetical protein